MRETRNKRLEMKDNTRREIKGVKRLKRRRKSYTKEDINKDIGLRTQVARGEKDKKQGTRYERKHTGRNKRSEPREKEKIIYKGRYRQRYRLKNTRRERKKKTRNKRREMKDSTRREIIGVKRVKGRRKLYTKDNLDKDID